MTNQHRTWNHKSRLVGENHDNSSLREEDEPDEGSGQEKVRSWSVLIKLKRLYGNFPFLPELLQDAYQSVWFMHDGAQAHFSNVLRNHLHATYPWR
ncbi:UNVERIFIED_CONTAM: hypothetical protein NCL1_32446 [Trichonephila clavipes]